MRGCVTPVDDVTQDFVIPWHVDAFFLLESISGGDRFNYQVIEKYPLA